MIVASLVFYMTQTINLVLQKNKYFINSIQVTFLAKQNCPATKQGHFSFSQALGYMEAISKTSL